MPEDILQDVKNGKNIDWRAKKLSTIDLSSSYKRLGNDKFYRIVDCSNYLEFKLFKNGDKKLHMANFCKVRLCPMCSWRRSLKIFGQVSKVMDNSVQQKDFRFIFLTLTCRNIAGEELGSQLDNLFYAYKKMMIKAKVKKVVKGWFRALEVTYNKTDDTYHPHFHIILMVNKSYFDDTRYYINQKEWTKLWQSSLKVEYTPIVDIRAFKTGKGRKIAKSIAEASKYAVKSNDFLIRNDDCSINEEKTDECVNVLDFALARRRLIAFGGILKDVHKELNLDDAENGDLINTGNEEEIREDIDYIIQKYNWNVGVSNYIRS